MRRLFTVMALAALVGLPVAPGLAQQTGGDLRRELESLKEGQARMQRDLELKKELEEIKEGQARLQKELEEIKTLLRARPAPAAPAPPAAAPAQLTAMTVDDAAPFKGKKDAKVTVIDFTDYQ